MNRNVSIIVVILVLVVIAGYAVWLRSKVKPVVITPKAEEQVQVAPTVAPTIVASPSGIPAGKEATGSTKVKNATSGAIGK